MTTSRAMLFRLGAVALGLLPLVIFETALTVADVARPELHGDPFVGFRSVRPLFVLDQAGERYVTSPGRLDFFRPESFAAPKPTGEFRIFCLGGSTVQGRPFAIETSFTTWLELALQTAHPERRWEVINCGGVSYASYRLVPILEEVLAYEPDLIVLYTGHNEFLEDRTYQHIKERPELVARLQEAAFQLRTVTLLREGYLQVRGRPAAMPEDRPLLPTEVEAMLDYQGGLRLYRRNHKWRRDIVEHYRYNLHRMIQLASDAHVPVLLVNPVTNLRDCPPFKSQHRSGLSEPERQRWELLWNRARQLFDSDMNRAIALLQEALHIDDQYAGLWYELAKCYESMGRYQNAHQAYIQAKELDVCPLRIIEPMHEAIADVAAESDTPLVDVRRLFEEQSRDGIPGGRLMVDHVHPSIEGHQIIALLLLDEMVRQQLVAPPPAGWEAARRERYAVHLESLDDFYFLKGHQRLQSLRNWAAGRAIRMRPPATDEPHTDEAPHGRAPHGRAPHG